MSDYVIQMRNRLTGSTIYIGCSIQDFSDEDVPTFQEKMPTFSYDVITFKTLKEAREYPFQNRQGAALVVEMLSADTKNSDYSIVKA